MAPRTPERQRLSRDRVLAAAVALADRDGVDGLSMRRLAQELGVVPMALYKHVANKEQLLDDMVGVLVGEIAADLAGRGADPGADPGGRADWRAAVRGRVLAGRRALLRHPWARAVLESRTHQTPATLAHVDAVAGAFLAGGFSPDLTHHVMHALGSRMWGFTQELFDTTRAPTARVDGGPSAASADGAVHDPEQAARAAEAGQAMLAALAQAFPNVAAIALTAAHDDGTVVGRGCDDQAEFEFALDLMLDGFARLHAQGWTPPTAT